MSTDTAPLKDMQFVIEELVGLADITAMPGCAEVTPDLVEAVLGEASKFANEVLDPLNRIGDEQGAKWADGTVTPPPGFADAYQQFIDAGWNSLSGPTEFGGQGLPHIVAMAVQEMWNSANMAFCLCPMLTSGVIEALKLRGSDAQKNLFMSKLVAGEWSGTMNLTEPQAGSDLSAVRTQALPEGDHYLIRGTKIFITWGEHDMSRNIVHLVLARTPGAPEGVKGISLFVVPKFLLNADGSPGARNDVKCVSIEHKMGIHASPTCVMSYGENGGAAGYMVGAENRGLETMFIMMNHARLGVGLEGVAIAERAYQHALDYAKTRVQGRAIGQRAGDRVTIINHPDVRRMLLSMKSPIEAMRALAYTASAALDKAKHHPDDGERKRNQAYVDLLIPIVKGWCTEQAIEIASTGVQIHGGTGFVEASGAAQYLRDARITAIYEGTTGIQAADLVGRKIGFEKGATAAVVIAQMRKDISGLTQNAHADVAAMHAALSRAVEALAQATQWVVEKFPGDPNAVAAVSVPYLKLWGIVAGGWLMGRAAELCANKLTAGAADADFCKTKIATARFYVEHILPQAAALAEEITSGASSVLGFGEAQF